MVSFHFFPFVTSTNQVAPTSFIFNEHIPRSQLGKPLHSSVFQQKFSINPFCSFLQLILLFVTCTSILAPAYALSHESILRSEIQKPLLQACYGRSWCWSLVQINCILYMIYYLHNNIKIEHFTSRWCVAAVVWQATRAYSWGWDTVIFRWTFESELVMTVFVISGVLWGRIFPQKNFFSSFI